MHPAYLYSMDDPGRILDLSQVADGYELSDVIGHPLEKFFSASCLPCCRRALKMARSGAVGFFCGFWHSPSGVIGTDSTIARISAGMLIGSTTVVPERESCGGDSLPSFISLFEPPEQEAAGL
jgi:hypothetical protein